MKFAIVHFPGTAGERDLSAAIQKITGEKADLISHRETTLDGYDVILIPGGASYGDAIRPGAIAKRQPVVQAIKEAAEKGKLVIGIGNGFQILTESGLLPGTLLGNIGRKFICQPVTLNVENTDTAFTASYANREEINIPIAHMAGNFYCSDYEMTELEKNNQVLLTYKEDSPNGSSGNIAGLMNKDGNVAGLMPHPERAIDTLLGSTDGVKFFQSIMKNWRKNDAANA